LSRVEGLVGKAKAEARKRQTKIDRLVRERQGLALDTRERTKAN